MLQLAAQAIPQEATDSDGPIVWTFRIIIGIGLTILFIKNPRLFLLLLLFSGRGGGTGGGFGGGFGGFGGGLTGGGGTSRSW